MRGLLVVVEGINGSGKSSIIKEVANHFERTGRPIVVYKFPDRKGLYGSHIDRYLKGELTISSKYDILHMFAANRKPIQPQIINDLEDNKIVICDRYIFSAIAYHIPNTVNDMSVVHNYCNVIGYFDKHMPIPNIIYMIEGDHLSKRSSIMEIFHHTGTKAQKLRNMIYNVIRNYTTRFTLLSNETGHMHEVVNYIITDIENCII